MAISFTIKNSEFRHKVLIQELKEISKDEDNLPIEEWITIRTAFAKITHQSGNESRKTKRTIRIEVRIFLLPSSGDGF